MAEELYSDTEQRLSDGVGRIFEAMTSCRTYQVRLGSTPVTITTRKVLAEARLGEERWSQQLTFSPADGAASSSRQPFVWGGWLRWSRARPRSSMPTWSGRWRKPAGLTDWVGMPQARPDIPVGPAACAGPGPTWMGTWALRVLFKQTES